MVPAVILLIVFFLGPIIWAIYTSLTDQTLSGATATHAQFIGIKNFRELFGVGTSGVRAVLNTAIFTAACVLIQNALGLTIALLMRNRNRFLRGIVGAIVVSCWIVPEIVAGFVWYSFLQPPVPGVGGGGTLSVVLHVFGLTQNWLTTLPVLAVILANGWRGTAFSMLVYGAAVGDIPPDQLESASVDGANGLARLRYVILPTLRRIIATNTLLITLQTLGVFTLIFTITGGETGATLPILMWQQFNIGQIGYPNAIAVVLLIVGGFFATFYLIVLRPDTN